MEAELDDLKESTQKTLLDDSNLEHLEELADQELGFVESTVTAT